MTLIPRKFYLDDFFNDMVPNKNNVKCDIYEKDNIYYIEMDMPGFDKNDIQIEMKNDYLTITAEKKEKENDENKNYICKERTYGKYERSLYIGDIDTENIKAEFKNGILKISVPKKEEVENKKVIEIND